MASGCAVTTPQPRTEPIGTTVPKRFGRAMERRDEVQHKAIPRWVIEALQRQAEMGAAFVARQGVDLIHDYRVYGAQHVTP